MTRVAKPSARTLVSVACLAALLSSGRAEAAEKEGALAADAMQTASEKALLLRAPGAPRNGSGMDAEAFAMLVKAVEQLRFDVMTTDPNSKEVTDWCMRSASGAAQRNEEVDTKGQALVTLEALRARCSEVYQYDLTGTHSCAADEKVKGQRKCKVNVEIRIAKFVADASSGTPTLRADRMFGMNGVATVKGEGTASDKVEAKAQRSAAFGARLISERGVRDIRYFQISSPIAAADGSTSSICLGKDILELDQPFYVYKLDAAGKEQEVGFGKVRAAFDGCAMTDALQARSDAGKPAVLAPARVQNILGRGAIQAGMTAREMPSVGLNFGVGVGFTTDAAEETVPRLDLLVEYNLARHVGISELHAAMHAGYLVASSEALTTLGQQITGSSSYSVSSGTAIQGELGLVKRFYGGAVSFELGAFAAVSYYKLAEYLGVEVGATGYGFAGKAGLGMQLSPRMSVRANAGYRVTSITPTLKVDGTEVDADPNYVGAEDGLLGGVSILYTY